MLRVKVVTWNNLTGCISKTFVFIRGDKVEREKKAQIADNDLSHFIEENRKKIWEKNMKDEEIVSCWW